MSLNNKDNNIFESNDNFSIGEFRKKISIFVNERDWKKYHTPKSISMAISIEAAELLENFLFKPDTFIPSNIELITDEMSDIFIYLMCLANVLNLNSFSSEILRKIEKNKIKYPINEFSGNDYQKQ